MHVYILFPTEFRQCVEAYIVVYKGWIWSACVSGENESCVEMHRDDATWRTLGSTFALQLELIRFSSHMSDRFTILLFEYLKAWLLHMTGYTCFERSLTYSVGVAYHWPLFTWVEELQHNSVENLHPQWCACIRRSRTGRRSVSTGLAMLKEIFTKSAAVSGWSLAYLGDWFCTDRLFCLPSLPDF